MGASDYMVGNAPRPASFAAPQVDFSSFGNLLTDYFTGTQQGRQRDLQNLFKDGLPVDPATGQPDIQAMSKKLIQTGGAEYGKELMPFLFKQDMFGKEQQALGAGLGGGGGGNNGGTPPGGSSAPTGTSPPQAPNMTSSSVHAGPDNIRGPGARPVTNPGQGNQAGSLIDIVTQAVGPERAGEVAAKIAPMLKISDPDAPLNDAQIPMVGRALLAAGVGRPTGPQGAPAPTGGGPAPTGGGLPGAPQGPQGPGPQAVSPGPVPGAPAPNVTGPSPDTTLTPGGGPADQRVNGPSAPSAGPRAPGQQQPGAELTDPRWLAQGKTPLQFAQFLGGLARMAAIRGDVEGAKTYQEHATRIMDAIKAAHEPTPARKDYLLDRQPGESMADYEARKAGLKGWAEPTGPMKEHAADRQPGESFAAYEARKAGLKSMAEVPAKNAEMTPEQKAHRQDALPGESMAAYDARKQGGIKQAQVGAENTALTPTQKEAGMNAPGAPVQPGAQPAAPGAPVQPGQPGSNPVLDFKRREAEDKEAAVRYGKDYEGYRAAGTQAQVGQHMVSLAKAMSNDPNFYSGPLEPANRIYKQFQAVFGQNPSSALPQEAFHKVINDLLTEQIRSMGKSGVGQVRVAEVKIMQQGLASLGITPATNRMLLEIVNRIYQDNINVARMAAEYKGGRLDSDFDKQMAQYYQTNPMFSHAEIKDPRLIAPREFPSIAAAAGAKMSVGEPFKVNGELHHVTKQP